MAANFYFKITCNLHAMRLDVETIIFPTQFNVIVTSTKSIRDVYLTKHRSTRIHFAELRSESYFISREKRQAIPSLWWFSDSIRPRFSRFPSNCLRMSATKSFKFKWLQSYKTPSFNKDVFTFHNIDEPIFRKNKLTSCKILLKYS